MKQNWCLATVSSEETERGRWNRETRQLGTISQGWTSRDWKTRNQIKQIETGWTSVGQEKKSILFDTIRQRRLHSRLQFLRAVSHSVGAYTESLHPRVDNSSNSSEDEDEDRQAPMLPATTSGASESATAAAATTSDDYCEVWIVALRAGFALVPCGHRTRTQYIRGRNDDKENF